MPGNDVCVRCGRDVPPEGRVPGAPQVLCQRCYEETERLRKYWTGDWPAGDPRDQGRHV